MTKSTNIPVLAKRVQENPEDSFSKFALALELLKIGKRQQCILLFEDIINRDPNYVGVYYHLGEQYFLQNKNKEALATYKQGIKVAENQNDLHAKSELQAALQSLELELEG